uniref:Uncharacterized protein n=1 Tax=Rhizophora mucronata TaxID=61149 RepID=A0A2P2R129_RHIMU
MDYHYRDCMFLDQKQEKKRWTTNNFIMPFCE